MIAPAESPLASPPPRTILIVDDDRSVADTFARMLKLEGFEVATAINAEAGLELADSVRPDAIILDMRMPITNGLQFLRMVRSKPHLVEVPVAIVTGDYFLPEPIQHELKSLGASIRFKPLWLEDLIALAKTLVSGVNDRFLRACRRQPVDATPVWFMRQAGRYMAEYRALRQRYSLLEICRHPDLAVAVTLQPVDAIDVDAAILFSDLLLPFTPMGLDFDFVKGEGPSIAASDPPRGRRRSRCAPSSRARRSVTCSRRSAAAPRARRPRAAHRLRRRAVHDGRVRDRRRSLDDLRADQGVHVRAARRVARALRPLRDHRWPTTSARRSMPACRRCRCSTRGPASSRAPTTASSRMPHTRRIFDALADLDVPTIHFGVGTTAILPDMAEAGGDVIGVDWRLPLDEAWAASATTAAIQGNLDPSAAARPGRSPVARPPTTSCAAPPAAPATSSISATASCRSTPLEHVQELARHVHRESRNLGLGNLVAW